MTDKTTIEGTTLWLLPATESVTLTLADVVETTVFFIFFFNWFMRETSHISSETGA